MLLGNLHGSPAWKIGQLILDFRRKEFIQHSYMEMASQRIGMKTLYKIGKLFVDDYMASFDKAPKKVIIDADDTNANTYGAQQLTLFNAYYNEYCYMPLLMFDGITGKLILPLFRRGRRNKSLSVAKIMRRLVENLHQHWPETIIELRGDSHFASHEFIDWAYDKWYVRYITGLSGNSVLLDLVDKPRRRAENDYVKAQKAEDDRCYALVRQGHDAKPERVVIRRYF